MESASITTETTNDHDYTVFEQQIRDKLAAAPEHMFLVGVLDLFQIYLDALPEEKRQHYRGNACRRFIDHFGRLVTIDESGQRHSVLWSGTAPPLFRKAMENMRTVVEHARVQDVFIHGRQCGVAANQDQKGRTWTHLSGELPRGYAGVVKNCGQRTAELRQEFQMLQRTLSEISVANVQEAIRVLESDQMDFSQKALAHARWFLDLKSRVLDAAGPQRQQLVWLAVATAPTGFCHVRSGMLKTLLDDILANLPFEAIKQRWEAKMHPLKYQRPTTLPAGQIGRAEEIFAELGIEQSILRRFATFADITETIWRPQDIPTPERTGGLFQHLRTAETAPSVSLPAREMSWLKFRREILPTARQLRLIVSPTDTGYCGLVAPQHPEAPPILNYDLPERRQPVSWFYSNGAIGTAYGATRTPMRISAVIRNPSCWHRPEDFRNEFSDSVIFIVPQLKYLGYQKGAMLFPQLLRNELREVRHVIERHGGTVVMPGLQESDTFGYGIRRGEQDGLGAGGATLEVVNETGTSRYKIVRWE